VPNPHTVPFFRCKCCLALYQVVKVEAAGLESVDPTCRVCNEPLAVREGQHVLKYFLLREAGRQQAPAKRADLVAFVDRSALGARVKASRKSPWFTPPGAKFA
jgi:hypothetical protein